MNSKEFDLSLAAAVKAASEKYGTVAIQAAAIEDGRVFSEAHIGFAELGKTPISADHKIRVASLTKTLVALVTVKLCELSLFSLDDNISKYIGVPVRNPAHPDVPITIRMLLDHTSSIRPDAEYEESLFPLRAKLLSRANFTEDCPGKVYRYNNFAYGVCGTICEIVSGKSVNALARQFFFEPLGISASFAPAELPEELRTVIYDKNRNAHFPISEQRAMIDAASPANTMRRYAGGLVISAADYAKLICLFLNDGCHEGKRLIESERISDMQRVLYIQPDGKTGQCLPMRRLDACFGEDEVFYHSGNAYGVYSLYAYCPAKRRGGVVITTGSPLLYGKNEMFAPCDDVMSEIFEKLR